MHSPNKSKTIRRAFQKILKRIIKIISTVSLFVFQKEKKRVSYITFAIQPFKKKKKKKDQFFSEWKAETFTRLHFLFFPREIIHILSNRIFFFFLGGRGFGGVGLYLTLTSLRNIDIE